MRYRERLLSALVGIALLAIPVTAAAKDHDGDRDNSRRSHASHFNAARNFVPRFEGNGARRWHENEWRHNRAWNNGNYGYNSYAPAVAPYGYQAPYYAPSYGYGANYGNSCAQRIQHLNNQAAIDRRRGHPAAAADLQQRMWTLSRECGSGLGGLGAPAYGYGGGYSPGYPGGYNQPSYGYNGYPSGYNQPSYGYNNGGLSALAPLLQGFIP